MCYSSIIAQQFTEQTGISIIEIAYGSVAWGDYDDDGDLDILLSGWDSSYTNISKIYRNNGNSTFTEENNIGLTGVNHSSIGWGDYDNDGDLDILLTGYSSSGNISKIYRNEWNNSFTEQTQIDLTGIHSGSIAWSDYDNDGDLDILITGKSGNEYLSIIYQNTNNHTFSEQKGISLPGIIYSNVACSDYDNDSNTDILLTGVTKNDSYLSKIYKNNGGNLFTELTSTNFTGVGRGSVAWGDYDNDGDLDILLTGFTNSNSAVSKIYKNDGEGLFTELNGANLEGVCESSVGWGDYDNDGNLDVLLTGYGWSKIYHNEGNNSFNEQGEISLIGVSASSAVWGDYDNDGDLDILLTGAPDGWSCTTKIYRNDSMKKNSIPSIPTNLSENVDGSNVTFRWNKSTDIETPQAGLTYNMRVGTTSDGCEIKSPMADISTGFRKVVQLGNTNQCNFYSLRGLPDGKYYWSVQAVDNNFAGSAFAPEQEFVVQHEDYWKIHFKASSQGLNDSINYIGVNPLATNDFDSLFDIPKSPEPPGDYVYLSFPHSEWNLPAGSNFSADIRASEDLTGSIETWKMDVKTTLQSQPVTISAIPDANVPTGYSILLKDLRNNAWTNLRMDSYTYPTNDLDSVRHFEVIVTGDTTKPIVTVITPNGGEILQSGDTVSVQWQTTDAIGVDTTKIYYSVDSGKNYQLIAMLGDTSQYRWIVPLIYLTDYGAIKVRAIDKAGNVGEDASDKFFTICGDSLARAVSSGWNLISLPLSPPSTLADSVFGDDLPGAYWLYGYKQTEGYFLSPRIRDGYGCWLGLVEPSVINVKGLAIKEKIEVPLQAGFNIIGNPFVRNISKNALWVVRGTQTIPFTSAVDSGWIANAIYRWNTIHYALTDSLIIWEGCWIGALVDNLFLNYDFHRDTSMQILSKKNEQLALTTEKGWRIYLTVMIGGIEERLACFGVDEDATSGFDARYDNPSPPNPPNGKFVSLHFPHPEWELATGKGVSTDIRSLGMNQSWYFEVLSSEKGKSATLKWELDNVPEGVNLVLIDEISGEQVGLKSMPSYQFIYYGLRRFSIQFVSTSIENQKANIPTDFILEQNYPNPFNPTTTIIYGLPRECYVEVKIYDILGKNVKTLSNKKPAGFYSITIDTQNLTSGIYIYRLTVGENTLQRKMVVIK